VVTALAFIIPDDETLAPTFRTYSALIFN